MSLKFGIYLVEQRIISPEQFCGLVKIQQETTMSLANVALRKNMMTIKQVAEVLDVLEAKPSKTFQQVAVEKDLIENTEAVQLLQYQNETCTSIRKLVVECGLLTDRQASVLFHHFERNPIATSATPAKTATSLPAETPTPQPIAPAPKPVQSRPFQARPRRPKFRSRPVIVHPYTTNQ